MIAIAVIFAVLIVFMGAITYFWGLNPDQVTVALTSDLSLTQPIPIMIIGAILVGLAGGFFLHIFSLSAHGIHHWRRGRQEKKGKEVISIYREGVARLLSGDIKKAHVLLQKALDREPSRVETCLALANVYIQEGEPQQGVNLLHKAKELEPRSMEVLFKLASTYEEMGRDSEASKVYEEILAIESDNRKALRNLRDLQVKQGRLKDALALQKRVLKVVQGSRRQAEEQKKFLCLRYEVASLSLQEGEIDAAKAELKQIIVEDPSFIPAKVSLGDAYQAQDRPEDAAGVWRDAYKELRKGIFLARLEDMYMEEEDPTSLLNFYRSQIMERGDDLLLRLFYGKLCLRLEMIDEALEQLQTVEGSGIELPQMHLLLAEAYRRRRNIDEAVRQYKKALGVDNRLRFQFVCEQCEELVPEWQSRCSDCGAWGSFVLPGSQAIKSAKPLDLRAIHHGQREEWHEEE